MSDTITRCIGYGISVHRDVCCFAGYVTTWYDIIHHAVWYKFIQFHFCPVVPSIKHSLNRACVLLFWEVKLLHVNLWQSISASTSKLYSYNTSIGNPKMFRTPVDGFFPDLLRAQNFVRVIEGKIILKRKWQKGKLKLVRVSGSSSYRGFELRRVKLQ